VELSSRRIGGRSKQINTDSTERYDHADHRVHDKLRDGFRKVAGFYPARFFILDASLPPEQVLAQACSELERRWGL